MVMWSWVLTIIGVTGLYFAGQHKVWGWLIGIGAQVLWSIYAINTHQYGFLLSCAAYAYVYAKNYKTWTRPAYEQPPQDCSDDCPAWSHEHRIGRVEG